MNEILILTHEMPDLIMPIYESLKDGYTNWRLHHADWHPDSEIPKVSRMSTPDCMNASKGKITKLF